MCLILLFFAVFAENWVILGVFYYPALYYPLLACGTLHNKVGYVLGSLLSWTHFGVLVWQKIDCPVTPLVSNRTFVSGSMSNRNFSNTNTSVEVSTWRQVLLVFLLTTQQHFWKINSQLSREVLWKFKGYLIPGSDPNSGHTLNR